MQTLKKYILLAIIIIALMVSGADSTRAQQTAAASDAGIINYSGLGALVGEPVSFGLTKTETDQQIQWNFGDGETATGATTEHIFKQTGTYKIEARQQKIDGTEATVSTLSLAVYSDYVLALIDHSMPAEEINTLAIAAAKSQLYLKTLRVNELQTLYQREHSLTELLVKSAKALSDARLLIDWTQGGVGLSALLAAQQAPNAISLDLSEKIIISVTKAITFNKRLAQLIYDVVQPTALVLVEKQALPFIVTGEKIADIIASLQQTGLKYETIQNHSPALSERVSIVNFFFPAVEYLAKRGLPLNTLMLILALPLIALFFIISKQIIGLRTFGLYIPVLLVIALLPLGLIPGLIVFMGAILITELIRPFFRWLRLSFLPRSAIIITAITLLLLGFFVVAGKMDYTHLLPYAIFPALLAIPLIEKFSSVRIENSLAVALRYLLETMLMVVISFAVINISVVHTLIISYPETIIIIALLAFLVGRFTGLRLVEYIRFQDLIRTLRRD